MKKLFAIIYFVFIAIIICDAESLDSLFIKANDAYSSGNYEQAFSSYKQIQEQNFESAELYFNMGNAAFRSNKLGYSILYYEKALKLDPSYEEAQTNLKYVSVYKEDQLDTVPEFFLKTWIKSLFSVFTVSIWSYIALGLFFITLLGILIYIFSRSLSLKKAGFFAGTLALLLFVLTFSAALNRNAEIQHPDQAVIIAPSVVVKSSPSLSGTDLFVLHEGTQVKIDEAVGEWIEIKISDGRVGWIQSETLELI